MDGDLRSGGKGLFLLPLPPSDHTGSLCAATTLVSGLLSSLCDTYEAVNAHCA